MSLLPRRTLGAIAAVVDVALHARPGPVSAKALAGRLGLPPRHLEPALQALVRGGILTGLRGPRGGYGLARERRRITVAAIVRAVSDPDGAAASGEAGTLAAVVDAAMGEAAASFLATLDTVTVEDLCRRAAPARLEADPDFTI